MGVPVTHWSTGLLAVHLQSLELDFSISESSVRRILQDADLQPHRQKTWLPSQDEEFRAKRDDVLHVYYDTPPKSTSSASMRSATTSLRMTRMMSRTGSTTPPTLTPTSHGPRPTLTRTRTRTRTPPMVAHPARFPTTSSTPTASPASWRRSPTECAEVAAAGDLLLAMEIGPRHDAQKLKGLASRVSAMLTGLIERLR